MPKITPFLWFDHQAEQAAQLYVSVFPNSQIEEADALRPGRPGPGRLGDDGSLHSRRQRV